MYEHGTLRITSGVRSYSIHQLIAQIALYDSSYEAFNNCNMYKIYYLNLLLYSIIRTRKANFFPKYSTYKLILQNGWLDYQ